MGSDPVRRAMRYWRSVRRTGPRTAAAGAAGLLAGAVLGVAAVALLAWSETAAVGSPTYWSLRELAGVAAAVGLPVALGGLAVLLAVRGAVGATGAGGVVCLLATGWFALAFPARWNTGRPADPTVEAVGLYVLGVLICLGGVAGAILTHRRAAGGTDERSLAYRTADEPDASGFNWVTDSDRSDG